MRFRCLALDGGELSCRYQHMSTTSSCQRLLVPPLTEMNTKHSQSAQYTVVSLDGWPERSARTLNKSTVSNREPRDFPSFLALCSAVSSVFMQRIVNDGHGRHCVDGSRNTSFEIAIAAVISWAYQHHEVFIQSARIDR